MSDAVPGHLVEVRDLVVSYGASLVLDGVSLDVDQGEAVALLGSNGAGKTTFIRALTGLLPFHGGRVIRGHAVFGGEDLAHQPPHRTVARGVVQVPEGRKLFAHLSVRENLLLGASSLPKRRAPSCDVVFDLFPRLAELQDREAGWLSGGEQQMVAIGRALMSQPTLLLLDEASLGLSPVAQALIFEALRRVRADLSISMLVVEQNADAALRFCNRGYVLTGGQVSIHGSSETLRSSAEVTASYLGRSVAPAGPSGGETVHLAGLSVRMDSDG
jgi:branched-chain amino acid transport system ATP-binding protein